MEKGKLIPLADLAPPYTAGKVDGLKVSDSAYPLVLVGGLRFDGGNKTNRLRKKTDALLKLVRNKLRDGAGLLFEDKPLLYTIAAGGDMMLARGAQEILFAEGPEGILGGTAIFVKEADLALVNL